MPAYERDLERFAGYDTQVLGISVDSIPSHQAWTRSLGGITYPILSDFWPHGAVCKKYGVLLDLGYADRVIVIVDKTGIIRYVEHVGLQHSPDNEKALEFLESLT
ncbi:MAG: redoxin domain-containing protein [Candidatus Zixiibacteriota bacterium]|nr:MAG: redoxin domain-containing protein [candidate division Zixibacteria bacterium]